MTAVFAGPPAAALLFLAHELTVLALFKATAWRLGDAVLGRWGPCEDDRLARVSLAIALGLGLIAQGTFVLGLVGLLDRWIVLTAIAAVHLLGWRRWRAMLAGWRTVMPPGRTVALAALVLAPTVALALYPPTGWDATLYHLPYVDAFVEAGRLVFVPEVRFPVFPQAVEMLFVVAYFLGGDVACQLTQALAMAVTAGLLWSWGRRLVGARAGLWATAIWLGAPIVVWTASNAYVDVGLTLFVTAALCAWERSSATGDRRWLVLAGAFAGLAAATKYLGLFVVGVLVVAAARRATASRSWRPLVELGAPLALVAGPWYMRLVVLTGNPLFPFYPGLFGESPWTIRIPQPEAAASWPQRIAEALGFLLRTPWAAVFDRGVFQHAAPMPPLLPLLVLVGLPAALFDRRLRWPLAICGGYALFWLTTFRDLRFLLVFLPLLALVLAAGVERALGRRAAAATGLLAVALIATGPLYALHRLQRWGPLPVTETARRDFLGEAVPGYRELRWLEENEPPGYRVYGWFAARLRYYAGGEPYLGELYGPDAYSRLYPVLHDGEALWRELRRRGATHFLVSLAPGVRQPRRQGPLEPRRFDRRFERVAGSDTHTLYRLRPLRPRAARQVSLPPPADLTE